MTTLAIGALLFAAPAQATDAVGHADPVASVALWLVVILLAAKLGGDLAVRLGQPAVLGELLVGVVLGNLPLVGYSGLEPIKTDPFIDMFARVGVLILLFEVGLESTVGQMLKVGLSSFLVATLGVIAPFALGLGRRRWLLPDARRLRPRVPRRHAHRDQRRHHRARAQGPRPLADERGAHHPRRGGDRRRARPGDPRGRHRGDRRRRSRRQSRCARHRRGSSRKAAGFLVGSLVARACSSRRRLFALAAKLRAAACCSPPGLAFCFLLSWIANADRARADRRSVRRRADPRAGPLPRLRRPRRARPRGAGPSDLLVPGADLLRAHGDAHRSRAPSRSPACSASPSRSPSPPSSASRPARSACSTGASTGSPSASA